MNMLGPGFEKNLVQVKIPKLLSVGLFRVRPSLKNPKIPIDVKSNKMYYYNP